MSIRKKGVRILLLALVVAALCVVLPGMFKCSKNFGKVVCIRQLSG